MTTSNKLLLTFLTLTCLLSTHLQGALVFATPNSSTGFVSSTGANNNGFPYAGSENPATSIRSAIFVFALPLLPLGESIVTADFGAFLFQESVSDVNVDLYALRVDNSNAKSVATDYFTGANDVAHTKITDNIVTPTSAVGSYYSSGASATLGSWLSAQYTGDTPNANFVFLRLNVDGMPATTFDLYRFRDDDDANPPILAITTAGAAVIPEPSTYMAIIGWLSLSWFMVRRRRASQAQAEA